MAIIRLSAPGTAGLAEYRGASLLEASIDQKAIDDLRRRLKDLPDKLARKLETRAVKKAADLVAKKASDLCPVRQPSDKDSEKNRAIPGGRLLASIKVRARRRSRRNRGTVGRAIITGKEFFTGPAYYGGMVEFGTSKMKAQSFLRAAAIECEGAATAIFRDELHRMIEEEHIGAGATK